MIINEVKPNIELSGDFESKFFGIGNLGMLFEILRNKMYSNVIQSVCREYISNAIDSHREAKCPEKPIHITIPNTFDSHFRVKDFGVGISPDRMENVFINYASSTKRNDNEQIGGFGQGGKVGFAYTDTFSITTIFDKIKYEYVCFIDETKVGKLMLVSKTNTDELNGTEIIIPIKKADFAEFKKETLFICKHFPILPKINGTTDIIPVPKVLNSGDDWFLAEVNKNDNYNGKVKLIVDFIEYPVDEHKLGKSYNSIRELVIYNDLYLKFKTGELSLSATREAVHLDEKTKKLISDKFEKVKNNIKDVLTNDLDKQLTYLDACIFVKDRKSIYNKDIFGDFKWKNEVIYPLSVQNASDTLTSLFFKKPYLNRKTNKQEVKTQKNICRYFGFGKNCKIFVNDVEIKDISAKYVSSYITDGIDNVYVISPVFDEKDGPLTTVEEIIKSIPKYVDYTLLSTVIDAKLLKKATKKVSAAALYRMNIFQFMASSFTQISLKDFEEYKGKSAYCIYTESNYYSKNSKIYSYNGKILESGFFKQYFPDYKLFAISKDIPESRVKEVFDGVPKMDDLMDNLLNSIPDIGKIKFAMNYYTDNRYSNHQPFFKQFIDSLNLKDLFPDNHQLLKFYDDYQEIIDLADKNFKLVEYVKIDDSFDIKAWLAKNPRYNFSKRDKELADLYPILSVLKNLNGSYYSSKITKEDSLKMLDYILMQDEKNKETKK